jgi:hypothetical protein
MMFKAELIKKWMGLALMVIGASLLAVCYVTRCETNTELLIGLLFIVLGFVLHIWNSKWGEKY